MMLSACIKQLKLQKKDFLQVGIVCVSFVAVAELIVNLVMCFGDPESYFMMAPFLLFFMFSIMALAISVAYWTTAFSIGLRMGATRREMTVGVLFQTLVMNVFIIAFAWLELLLERTLGVGYWVNTVGKDLEFDVLFSLPWWSWLLSVLVCTVGGLLFGTVILRFGRKGFWVIWGLWMAGALGPSLLPDDFNIPIVGTPLWTALPWVAVVVVLALCFLAVRTLLRLPVREG